MRVAAARKHIILHGNSARFKPYIAAKQQTEPRVHAEDDALLRNTFHMYAACLFCLFGIQGKPGTERKTAFKQIAGKSVDRKDPRSEQCIQTQTVFFHAFIIGIFFSIYRYFGTYCRAVLLQSGRQAYYSTGMKQIPSAVRADILGYCMGVRRAVEMAEQAAADFPQRRVFTLGPLIHNTSALASLEKKGVCVLSEDMAHVLEPAAEGAGPVVILRAHGVPPQTKALLAAKGCTIIDATCPRVLVNQKRAADFGSKGYTVIIAGEKNHGEVTGIAGYCERCVIVGSAEEAKTLCAGGFCPERAVLISQTTISRAEYDAISSVLRGSIAQLHVFDTICPATVQRQDALLALRGRVDGVLVIGGRHSANTQRLYMTAKECFARAALIEQAEEIPREFYALSCVGLTAGASTPDCVIDAVEAALLAGDLQGA